MISSPQNPATAERPRPSETWSDAQLLCAFVRHKEEAAFEYLVRRHGPMVLGVCRRLLGNEHDAADAFQAAFIVLARKAVSLRTPEVLGTWLYQVAYRTSMKARSLRFKRAVRERQVSVMPEPAVETLVAIDDLSEVLDEELRTLPAKYQGPIILCDLEGRSRKEAAAALRLAEGTLSSRLATARHKLAERLRRRGIVVSAAALGLTLAQTAGAASLPAPLVLSTVQAALPALAGQVAVGVASAQALTLVDGVMKAMFLAKLKLALLAVLGFCALTSAVGVALVLQPDEETSALATLNRLGARLKWEAGPTGKQLVGVDLKRTPVKNEHLKVLGVFKHLRELVLSETAVSDAGCDALAALEKLQVLRLYKTGVSDDGVKKLAALNNLRVLTLGYTKVGNSALKDVATLVELRELDLRQTRVTDAGLNDLAPLKKVQTLDLGKTSVTDAELLRLTALPQLRTLRIDNTAVTDAGMKHLAACAGIESLSLEGDAVTDAGLKDLAPLQSLKSLNLNGTRVTDAGLPGLADFKQLRTLMLDRTGVTAEGLADAEAFKLTALWLNATKVTDATIRHVAALATLQKLHLDNTQITDGGVKQLTALTQLDSLGLDSTLVTDSCVEDLVSFKRLLGVNLSGTKVTDTGLKQLATVAQLQWLALHNTTTTDAGLKSLTALKDLDTLWLSWTKVSEAGLKELAAFKRLHVLRLGGLKVTDNGLKDVVVVLPNLHTLWLDWTKITDAGLKELVSLRQLEELRLDGTAVTAAGLKELAALKQLQRVDVQAAKVTDAQARALQTTLPRVAITAREAAEPAPGPDNAPRLIWWLVALMGGPALLALIGWLLIKRRWPLATAACGTLAVAAIVALNMFQTPTPAIPAASQSAGKERVLRGHTGPVQGLQFTPDGRRLISAGGWPGKDPTVRIWDLEKDEELYKIPAPAQIGALILSPDGRYALAGAMGALLYIDVETGEVVQTFRKVSSPCTSLAFSADGKHFWSASQDGFARRWDMGTGREVARFKVAGKWARLVTELPDGRLLTADSDGLLQFWDVASGTEVKRINAGPVWVGSTTAVPGGRHVLLGTWGANLWDLQTGEKVRVFQHKLDVCSMKLSPDGKTLATASFDGTARLWDFQSGDLLRTVMTQEEYLLSTAFSRDGRWIAVAGGGRKEGKDYLPGTSHDIHLFELAAPPPAVVASTIPDNRRWFWTAGFVGVAVILATAAAFFVRRRRSNASASDEPEASPSLVLFLCAHCGKRLKVKSRLVGREIKCPQCAVVTRVPAVTP